MNDVGQSMHDYSPTTFLSSIFVAILGVHLLEGKVAVFILESSIIERK